MTGASGSSHLVLASASPRRRALLEAAGIAFDVDPQNVDERPHAEERPERYVERVAIDKARAAAARHPDRPVLAADTVVVVDHHLLGKPIDPADAVRMLQLLSGRAHLVLTAVAVMERGVLRSSVERTTVWMRPIAAEEIQVYVATGEPLDKAGGYAIQGGAGQFVDRIEGALDTVVGLPIARVRVLLHPPDRPR